MVKRSLALVLAGLLTFTAVGCGAKDETKEATKTETPKGEGETKEDAKKEEPITIEWMGYDGYAQPDDDSPVVLALEEKLNVDFDIWKIPKDSFEEAFSIRLAGGDLPDVFKTNIKSIPNYQKQGILGELPLETIYEKAPNLTKIYNEFSPDGAIWKGGMFEGVNYGMPRISMNGTYGQLVVWRKDWLDNVGITKVPETLEEFEEALYRFRHNDPDGNGVKDTYGMSDYAQGMIFGAYGIGGMSKPKYAGSSMMVNEEGLPTFAITQPGTKEALETLNRWYEDEIIDPEFITSEDTSGYWAVSEAFMNSRIGLTSRSYFYHWKDEQFGELSENVATFRVNNPDGEYVYGTPPVGPEGLSGTSSSGYINNVLLFTTKCVEDQRKVDTILKMWDLSYTGENQDNELYELLNHGIEGEHFYYDENGIPQSKLEGHGGIEAGLIFKLQDPADELRVNADLFEFADEVSPKNVYQKVLVPPTEEYSQYKSDIRRMGEEAVIAFITGERSLDEYDEFLETYLKHGGQETQDAIQEAWAANK